MPDRLRKRAARAAAATTLLALLGGCVYSIHPWYVPGSEGDDSRLIGEWSNGEELWIFLADEGGLRLIQRDDGRLGEFRAVTFEVEATEHLDLVPLDEKTQNSFLASHLLPMHGVLRWAMDLDTLCLVSLDLGRAQKVFLSRPFPGEKIDDRWVFTGPTVDVFAYLKQNLAADSLWSDTLRLGRIGG